MSPIRQRGATQALESACAFLLTIALLTGGAAEFPTLGVHSAALIQELLDSGISPDRILGMDSQGLPLICGTGLSTTSLKADDVANLAEASGALPPSTRSWETIPGAILNDGMDAFRVEVNLSDPVNHVMLDVWTPFLSESGLGRVMLRDDGQNGDRMAADRVYTSERLRFDTRQQWQHPPHYHRDTNSPAGISIHWAGNVVIEELNGFSTGFVMDPQVGVLSSNMALTTRAQLASHLAVSPHLINVQSADRSTQLYLRQLTSPLFAVTAAIYGVLPDVFDVLVFFSADHIERLPYTATPNFNAGLHHTVQVNYTGTGQRLRNDTVLWGNPGRLLGINIIDSYERGIAGYNVTHELLHQWSSYTTTAIADSSHYAPRSNVASLLGGYLWVTNAGGGYTLICEEGREGATHAAPLDQYMMGLIAGSAVEPLRVYSSTAPSPYGLCNLPVPTIASTVTIADIQAVHGVRQPGPASAKRDFSIGFVVESHRRLLSPIEMTFYEILAAHYTRSIPLGHADPHVGGNWPPIERYFGDGVTWRSDVLSLIQPTFHSIERLPNGGIRLAGAGYPGRTYTLQASVALTGWSTVTATMPATDGSFSVTLPKPVNASTFYRLIFP